MYINLFWLFTFCFGLLVAQNKELTDTKNIENLATQDKTLAIIYHTEGSYVILQSDLKPNLDGRPRTLKDLILERLMLLDAQNLKVTVTDADVDRYLAQIQKQNNLSKEDLEKAFEDMNLSFEQGCEQLKNSLIINSVLDYRVKNKSMVGQKEIEDYYNQNPVYEEAEFVIAQSVIPFEGSPDKKKIKIDNAIRSGEIIDMVLWEDPVTLQANEFAQDKAFIKDLDQGSIVKSDETEESITLIRLISKRDKRLIPLDEREMDIANILGKEKFDIALKAYNDKLLDPKESARIRYID